MDATSGQYKLVYRAKKVFNQHENFRNAILKKKARVEEINLILSQPIRPGPPTNSRRRLIEEKLHLELAIGELEREDARLRQASNTSEQARVAMALRRLFNWHDFDQRILSYKRQEVSLEMGQRIKEMKQKISFETAQLHNTAAYVPRLLKAQEALTDEWAGKLYVAHCEAWTEQNGIITPSFIRAVRDKAIRQLFSVRESSIKHDVLRHTRRTGRTLNTMALRAWTMNMSRLANRWHQKLEAEAAAAEHRLRSQVTQQRELPGGSVQPRLDGESEKRSSNQRSLNVSSNSKSLMPKLNYRSS